MAKRNNNLVFYILCTLLLFLGINGLTGGLMLIIKPDGSLLGMDPMWLEGSPFQDYIFPGLLLFAFLGVMPVFTFIGLIRHLTWRWLERFNLYGGIYWAWTFSIYVGLISIIWITVQLVLTQYFWIQPVIIFIGIGILICSLSPQLMTRFKISH